MEGGHDQPAVLPEQLAVLLCDLEVLGDQLLRGYPAEAYYHLGMYQSDLSEWNAAEKGPCRTLGELVHNRAVTRDLAELGVGVLDKPENASQAWSWSLSGNYDPKANTLVMNGFRLLYTYKADGELDLDADQQDEEVNAVFAFDEEGYLVCTESTDPAIMGIKFELDPESYGMWAWVF